LHPQILVRRRTLTHVPGNDSKVTTPVTDLPLLRLRNVTLRVRGENTFPDTTWTLARGEQWLVVGGTGSGKSTLLRAICGDVPVARGEIEYGLDGRRLREGDFDEGAIEMVSLEEHRRLVAEAMDYHQARWSPVGEREPVSVRDLVFAGRGSRRRWRELATLLEIGDLLGRGIGSLSNGEMRKVLLARALLAAPKLLILDNPFAGLDTESRRKLRSVLHQLMGDGIPILLATARLDEIPRRVTHLLCVEAERVVAQGRRRAVLTSPAGRRLAHPGKGQLHELAGDKGHRLGGLEDERLDRRRFGDDVLDDGVYGIVIVFHPSFFLTPCP